METTEWKLPLLLRRTLMGKKTPTFEKGRVICLSLLAKSQYSGCADKIDLLINVPGLLILNISPIQGLKWAGTLWSARSAAPKPSRAGNHQDFFFQRGGRIPEDLWVTVRVGPSAEGRAEQVSGTLQLCKRVFLAVCGCSCPIPSSTPVPHTLKWTE